MIEDTFAHQTVVSGYLWEQEQEYVETYFSQCAFVLLKLVIRIHLCIAYMVILKKSRLKNLRDCI